MRLLVLFTLVFSVALHAQESKPIRALMVAGGCCHDYENQKNIVAEGISARAKVEWVIVQESKDRGHKNSAYDGDDWAKDFDIVVHNECYGGVTDEALIAKIAKAHADGLPGVALHCSMHSYRAAKNADLWRAFLGVTSTSHEKHRPVAVKNLAPKHPIMTGFPEIWTTPNGELYKISKVWDTATPLAQAYGEDTKKDHVCVWINEQEKSRTFGTTLGHHNVTMESEIWLNMVARGFLWALDKLDEQGNPKAGYGPVK